MLAWLPRGLRGGRITTSYPKREELPAAGFHGQVHVSDAAGAQRGLEQVCPTGAIRVTGAGTLSLDRGRCIQCGACVRRAPERFAFERRYESAVTSREQLKVGDRAVADPHAPSESGLEASDGADLGARRRSLREQARALGRSVHIRHIDTGSDGAEEWEIQALWNPYYDIQRLGFFLTSSPRHADVLMVSGGVTAPMRKPLERTWELMPEPKALIAVGTDACSGGLSADTGTTAGGVDRVLPVDVYIPGSPPSPIALIDGLLMAVGLLRTGGDR